MQIAILSDIHDNVWKLRAALTAIQDSDLLICCGDLCSPFIVGLMADNFSKDIHIVFGNNDGDLYRITQNAAKYKNEAGKDRVILHGQFYSGEFDGRKIAVNHYPDIALPIAESGKYDVVCYGHNHLVSKETKRQTLFINPGTIMGYDPVAGANVPSSYALYDTNKTKARFYKLIAGNDGREKAIEFSV